MVFGGLWAGLAIVGGAVLVLVLGEPSVRMMAVFLGLAAGVMLAAAAGDLLPQAVLLSGFGRSFGGLVAGGLLLGGLRWLSDCLPAWAQGERRLGYLVFAGVALHDILEGLAVAVGYSVEQSLGLALVAAVGVHHVPEGIAMAAPLYRAGVARRRILLLSGLTALMTPLGTGLGLGVQGMPQRVLGVLLAMAAGAMAALALGELLPGAKQYHIRCAMAGLMVGLVAMSLLCWMS